MLHPGKGTPPELGRPCAPMLKGTRVPEVPWHWKDPDDQTSWRSQGHIPTAGPFPWQQQPVGAGSQRQQPLIRLNQKARPGRDDQPSSIGSEQKTNRQTPAVWGRSEELCTKTYEPPPSLHSNCHLGCPVTAALVAHLQAEPTAGTGGQGSHAPPAPARPQRFQEGRLHRAEPAVQTAPKRAWQSPPHSSSPVSTPPHRRVPAHPSQPTAGGAAGSHPIAALEGRARTGAGAPQGVLGNAGPQGHFHPSNSLSATEVSSASLPGKTPCAPQELQTLHWARPAELERHKAPWIPANPQSPAATAHGSCLQDPSFLFIFYPPAIPELDLLPPHPPTAGSTSRHEFPGCQGMALGIRGVSGWGEQLGTPFYVCPGW
ncbi:transcription initiation factor TFIID subunit 4-like [Falco naumanni]|uniref:transcription initiation factor TFIID subunit 4-like n=1 Tax=Falco naumanni TaxID=148594 RepID=UPI001ADE4CD1|nr:transcription initiation factor TFIID subunit 4-like [Falco naumanni]